MSRFDLALVALRWLGGCWLLWRVGTVGRSRTSGTGSVTPAPPPCSIVVPARDEARALPVLLASLLPQLRPSDELVVIDDDSSDDTASVAHFAGASVRRAPPLPEGWTGKNAACWAGAAEASTDVLVFLDADTRFEPGGLARLLHAHADRGGLLSVQPFHTVARPYERLSAFFNIVAMMGIDAFTPLRERRAPSGAFGPVLVTSVADYHDVGGHRAVADQVLDDVALARAYTAAGRRVTCLGGRGIVSFRMYPDGIGHLMEGWTKNFAGGAAGTRKVTLVLVAAWISLCLQAGWWVAGLAWRDTATVVVLGVYAAVAAQVAWMLRRIGTFGARTAVLFPIPLVFFVLVFVRSIVDVYVRRRVRWKGRELATGRRVPGSTPARRRSP